MGHPSNTCRDVFVDSAKNKWGGRYFYNYINFINKEVDVEILCPSHGPFTCTPSNHLDGVGCNYCPSRRDDRLCFDRTVYLLKIPGRENAYKLGTCVDPRLTFKHMLNYGLQCSDVIYISDLPFGLPDLLFKHLMYRLTLPTLTQDEFGLGYEQTRVFPTSYKINDTMQCPLTKDNVFNTVSTLCDEILKDKNIMSNYFK